MPLLKFGNHILKQGKFLSVAGSPFKQTVFNDIGEIYANLKPGDKVAFLLRHGERGDGTGKSEPLTENGIQQCRAVGAKIRGGVAEKNQIEAHSTDFVRTQQTAFYIADSRGDDLWPSYTNVPTDHNISSEMFYADGYTNISYEYISAYAYDQLIVIDPAAMEYFKNIDQITNEITVRITSLLQASDKPLMFFTSHDSVILPYTVHRTKGQLDCLKFWKNHQWINYCAGTAVILRANGTVETYPVKGLDEGWFIPW